MTLGELIKVLDEAQQLHIYEPNEIAPDYEMKVYELRMEDINNILGRTVNNMSASTNMAWYGETSEPFFKIWLD